jgi:hypothetical protein
MATLTLDLSPQRDDGGRWFISVDDERGALAYAYFDSEAQALSFIDAVLLFTEQFKGE